MKRTTLNLIVDLIALLLFLGMLATGYILWFPLSPETGGLYTLWGRTRHQWGAVHFWTSIALLGILAFHIVLHGRWLASVLAKRLHGSPPALGSMLAGGIVLLLLLAALFALFAWSAHHGVREIEYTMPAVIPPAPSQAEKAINKPDFWKQIYPILEAKCLACHGLKRQQARFRVDQKEGYFSGKRPWVVPGDSAKSPLLAIISGAWKDLPLPEKHRLADGEVALLKAWIDSGADWPTKSEEK